MGAIASQITSLTIIYSTVYSGTFQRKHQSSALLAFVRGNCGEFTAYRCFHLMTSSWRDRMYFHRTWILLSAIKLITCYYSLEKHFWIFFYKSTCYILKIVPLLTPVNNTLHRFNAKCVEKCVAQRVPITHLPLDEMNAISRTTFLNAFSWMKNSIFD